MKPDKTLQQKLICCSTCSMIIGAIVLWMMLFAVLASSGNICQSDPDEKLFSCPHIGSSTAVTLRFSGRRSKNPGTNHWKFNRVTDTLPLHWTITAAANRETEYSVEFTPFRQMAADPAKFVRAGPGKYFHS